MCFNLIFEGLRCRNIKKLRVSIKAILKPKAYPSIDVHRQKQPTQHQNKWNHLSRNSYNVEGQFMDPADFQRV